MKTIKQLQQIVESSDAYCNWKSESSDAVLTFFFSMFSPKEGPSDWQLGYYLPTGKMTTFVVQADTVSLLQEGSDIFKKPDESVLPLNTAVVQCNSDQAFSLANERLHKERDGMRASKVIVILQHLKQHGQIWNITFITAGLRTFNVKISADTGVVIDTALHSLLEYQVK